MKPNPRDAQPVRHLIRPKFALWFVFFALAVMTFIGYRARNRSRPAPYDGMVKQLHAGMTYDTVVARLGKPYLSEYNVESHVSAIYRVDGTILPFIVRFQKVESLVIHDPTAPLDSWCAYVRVGESGDSSVLLFAPASMSVAEEARWISGRADGFSFPGQAVIEDMDPNRPLGDGSGTRLVEVRSVRNAANATEDGALPIAQVDALNLRLVCHPVF